MVINLQFIFQDGSRGGRFQVFRKAVPQRYNSVEKGISEGGSSAKVRSEWVGGAEASQMLGWVVDIIFGVEIVESGLDFVEGNDIFHLIPVRNREKVKKFQSVRVRGVVILKDIFGRSSLITFDTEKVLIEEPKVHFRN